MTYRYFLFALLAVLFLSESTFAQLASQPTVQASDVRVLSATSNSVALRWTNGNGQRRLVTMRLTNSAAAPVDGTTYTANTAFGSGSQIGTGGTFVVYNGTDTTVTVTGLTASSAYTVGVWEYNGLTTGTQNYNPNSGTNLVPFYTTSTPPTTSPTNLTISNPTPTSVSLNFTAGNVSLKLYDMLGKEVMTLVSGRQNAGAYNLTLNASTLSSGIYFYRLQAGTTNGASSFVQTKKMIVVK